MESRRSIWLCGSVVAAILLLSSCKTVVLHRHPAPTPRRGYGPPVHAQANGQHRKVVYGYEVVYDAGCGLYVVVGMTNWYYHEGHFYRLRGDVWEVSLRGDAWGPAHHDSLPPGLRVKTSVVTRDHGGSHDVIKTNGNGNSVVKLNGNGDPKSNVHGYVAPKSNGNGKGSGRGKR